MMLFDLAALAYNFQNRFLDDTGIDLRLIDPNAGKLISDLNQKAHANPFYLSRRRPLPLSKVLVLQVIQLQIIPEPFLFLKLMLEIAPCHL